MNQSPAQIVPSYATQRQPQQANVQNVLSGQNGTGYQMQQNIPMNGGMGGYYQTTPSYNPTFNAQQFNGYDNMPPRNPTMKLPNNTVVVQQQSNLGQGAQYEVYTSSLPTQVAPGFQAQMPYAYYGQNYGGMAVFSGASMIPPQQAMPIDSQYGAPLYPSGMQNSYQMQQPPHSAPQTAPQQSAAPVQPRTRKVLNFIDPTTGDSVLKADEKATPPVEVPEQPVQETVEVDEAKIEEDAKKRFLRAIIMAKGDDVPEPVVNPEIPVQTASTNIVQQPAPASSAPPPSININEEHVQHSTSVKAASVEPTIQNEVPIQHNNDTTLTVDRPISPALTATPDAKEQQEEPQQTEVDKEKILDLERRFNKLDTSELEKIEQKVYSFEVMDMIREIVKSYKKVPVPGDPDLLKRKGLDIQSEPLQQAASRSKFANTNAFIPNWSNNQQQVYGSRKLYQGRHSDNKRGNPKNKPVPRPSFDRANLRQPAAPPVLDLRKADNAWKPKRRGEAEVSEEDKKYEILRKDVRSLLNKITPTSFEALKEDFFKMDVGQNERSQKIAIELIFDKAVEEPKFCPLYTDLCKEQVDLGKRTSGSFFHSLLLKVQTTFEGNSAFDTNIKELEDQLKEETEEKKKADLEERLIMLKEKEKRYILGNIKFISHLYTMDLIVDNIISFCLSKLHQMFEATNDDIYVQYGIELLELISKEYFSEKKKAEREKNDKNQSADNVTTFVNWVSTKKCKDRVSTKINVLILNFEDFMNAGYQKRNADKGPKKISELHEEIRKEEENRRMERITYDAQKKEDRFHHQRNSYVARSSIERKNPQEKRANAVAASINTVSSVPVKKTGLLKSMAADSTNKLGKQSYFSAGSKKSESDTSKDIGGPDAEKPANPGNEEWTTVTKGAVGQVQSRKSSLERN